MFWQNNLTMAYIFILVG